ncbi:mRNA interferase YafO [Vibrio crassostreae]|uniref:type II toxin-antitoxin system YafO family toxin n=1 Tax=Vibrio crassostreae TaxID=246167 RepID=UPI000F467F8D|nr:type II toxin-antitoxin system YafO family toxin [Vibrio crassostreae]ROO48772.1 type II toxin-antitoxin system toxin YafO [Vibrio crassostreae]TCT58177.1 type II toxin-antitoxin system toxin YafO [Vibrio crassostreae]TCT78968.1 type II toxin-antitoxin system toxin YafO [Vibrio crassostreae]CAK1956140.1 mRNA interferase YafO [Vibrio crassostreae]CAK1969944.1 mRNA interferase YafO [Vibrio crassostreae]
MSIIITKSAKIQKVLAENPSAHLPINEFEEYKTVSVEFDDIPNPTETVQLQHPAHLDTIGRDKLATHPIDARAEELHHVHIWQDGCVWEEESGDLKVQWSCTSNSYIVYSYFIDKDGNHHFHVIDYCLDQAHALIEDAHQVSEWTGIAKTHRLLFQ